jgi:hypothetical protein
MENKIITVPKGDGTLTNEAFDYLMTETVSKMNKLSRRNPAYFQNMSPSKLEEESCEAIKSACEGTPFNPSKIELVSGHRFPDIIAEESYGVEVKSTKADHWTSTGSSIVESTRNDLVQNIYMLFGKLGGEKPEFKCRPYSEVLSEIAVTHSPRYLIDMRLKEGETIFDKMDTTYDEFRTSEDNIAKVRAYYIEKAKKENKQEMPWWISSTDVEKPINFNLRMWNSVGKAEKKIMTAYCLILFPQIWRSDSDQKKYQKACLWLCSFAQIIIPNMRDIFSASGKVALEKGDNKYPHIVKTLVENAPYVKQLLQHPTAETIELIKEFNPSLLRSMDLFNNWIEDCCINGNTEGAPLAKWINEQPKLINVS